MTTDDSAAGGTILIVDDQREIRDYVRGLLEQKGYSVVEAESAKKGFDAFKANRKALDLVILDLDFGVGEPSGIDLLRDLEKIRGEVPVVILSGRGSAADGATALRLGAVDVLEKDNYFEQSLEMSVEKIRKFIAVVEENRRLAAENESLRARKDELEEELGRRYAMVGNSAAFRSVLDEARKYAEIPRPVLVRGERGTGKELVASLIHEASPRASGPFVAVNCAAFTGSLLESEIFGHEKGAFTGATARKIGRFERANGGTLFLDEIGNMGIEFQEKILRVIEYQRFERVSGTETVEVDVRIVAATNSDLEAMMESGEFRRDLYDRLTFKVLRMPPLRERSDDVPKLVEHFQEQLGREVAWVAERRFNDGAIEELRRHPWPGNVRELKNVVERLLCLDTDPEAVITAETVRLEFAGAGTVSEEAPTTFKDKVVAFERDLLVDALQRSNWNQKAAAELLGMTYDQLRHYWRKYELKELAP